MRRHTTTLLLSFLVLAASCSKNNYALVEPDDLYFTHKDRKEALKDHNASSAIIATTPTEVATSAQDGYEYANQHAPVLTTPSSGTINSTTLGSPTIQQYGQEPYYDSSVNPDYIPSQEYENLDESYSQYYIPEYQYTQPQNSQTPQITNNYYGVSPYNSYSSFYDPFYFNMAMVNSPRFGNRWGRNLGLSRGFVMGYSIWSGAYNDWYYAYDGFYSNGFYSNCYYSPYTYSYFGHPSYYNNYGNIYYGGGGSSYIDPGVGYADGTKIVKGPRRSMNNVSYYVDKANTPIKSRRSDYMPSGGESGRVADNSSRNANPTPERVEYMRRGNSSTYTVAGTQDGRRQSSSVTVQQSRTRTDNNRTVVVPSQNRRTYSNRNATSPSRTTVTNANRSNTRQSTYTRQKSSSRYSTPTRTKSSSRYGTPSRSSSRSSGYSPSRSSTRSSYTPSRSSGSSGRSSYTPSRSSGGSRSSGTRSSGSRSSSSSRSKRN